MCFTLYIAAPVPLPIIPWDEQTRQLHTEELSDYYESVRAQFQDPHVLYVGSRNQCGCGFRHAMYQGGGWPEEEWRPEGDTSQSEAQPDHEMLVQFIRQHVPVGSTFELFGMWEGNEPAQTLSSQSIPLERLLDLDFCFRDGGHYVAEICGGEIAGS
jgi:hypothetical protein